MESTAPLESLAVRALRDAVEAIGSQSAMARLLGVTQPAVSKWLAGPKMLPPEHVLLIERETGIPKERLRPDIYPVAAPALDAAPISNAPDFGALEPAR